MNLKQMNLKQSIQTARLERWDKRIFQREIDLLKREKEHLCSKKDERPLTAWEQSRLEEIFDELMGLLDQFRKISIN
jgi:hypothetical protein